MGTQKPEKQEKQVERVNRTRSQALTAYSQDWTPPLPADSEFVSRVLTLISQADADARELAGIPLRSHPRSEPEKSENQPTKREISPKPASQPSKRPSARHCKRCGIQFPAYGKGCVTCSVRKTYYKSLVQKRRIALMGAPLYLPRKKPLARLVRVELLVRKRPGRKLSGRQNISHSRHLRRSEAYRLQLCMGCGVPWDEITAGCDDCAARHYQRAQKLAKSASLARA